MLEIPPNKIKMSLIGILKIICPVYFIILMNKKTDNDHLVKEGGVKAVLWLVMVIPDWSLVNKAPTLIAGWIRRRYSPRVPCKFSLEPHAQDYILMRISSSSSRNSS